LSSRRGIKVQKDPVKPFGKERMHLLKIPIDSEEEEE
jgi:hypothetical protein